MACAKQASCLLHWLSVFKLAVPLKFPFYSPTKPFIPLYFKYKTLLILMLKIFFIILDISFKCKYKQETRSIHDSINIPKIELIS